MGRVEGKVAVVTGAAGGIGRGISLMLAREGASVVATDINQDGLKETLGEIEGAGGRAVSIKHDVTSEAGWSKVMDKTLSQFGGLDIMVNNAGIMLIKELAETSLEEWRRVMSVNLDGVFLGTKHAIRAMREHGGGSIINMSSVVGLIGRADDTAAYSTSKGGVRLLTKAAAMECSKAGHDYNIGDSITPGCTELTRSSARFWSRCTPSAFWVSRWISPILSFTWRPTSPGWSPAPSSSLTGAGRPVSFRASPPPFYIFSHPPALMEALPRRVNCYYTPVVIE